METRTGTRRGRARTRRAMALRERAIWLLLASMCKATSDVLQDSNCAGLGIAIEDDDGCWQVIISVCIACKGSLDNLPAFFNKLDGSSLHDVPLQFGEMRNDPAFFIRTSSTILSFMVFMLS